MSVAFSSDGRWIAHMVHMAGNHVELIPLQPDEETLAYRRLHTQPNLRRYREGYEAALAAKDDFAARFDLKLVPLTERTRIQADPFAR